MRIFFSSFATMWAKKNLIFHCCLQSVMLIHIHKEIEIKSIWIYVRVCSGCSNKWYLLCRFVRLRLRFLISLRRFHSAWRMPRRASRITSETNKKKWVFLNVICCCFLTHEIKIYSTVNTATSPPHLSFRFAIRFSVHSVHTSGYTQISLTIQLQWIDIGCCVRVNSDKNVVQIEHSVSKSIHMQ